MIVEASAPIRVCDIGGWTDTWFGGPGRVLNVAVEPRIHVRIEVGAGDAQDAGTVVEAARRMFPVEGTVRVTSGVPPGAGTGTSASLAVATIAALTEARGESRTPREIAWAAYRLEAEVLGQESGVQDQLAAALGGISYIEVDRFPDATVETLPPWPDLDGRLELVLLGRPHDSSAVHRQVMAAPNREAFDRLRGAARDARQAVMDRDLRALGRAMQANNEAQAGLHPALISVDARQLMDHAEQRGALGWKVNGAGGVGGSLTLLWPEPVAQGTSVTGGVRSRRVP